MTLAEATALEAAVTAEIKAHPDPVHQIKHPEKIRHRRKSWEVEISEQDKAKAEHEAERKLYRHMSTQERKLVALERLIKGDE